VPQRDQADEVAPALVVTGQQHQVVPRLGQATAAGTVEARGRRDIDLAAQDGLDPLAGAGIVEFDGAVQVAMIGEGASGQAQLAAAASQGIQADGPVQERVFGMDVQGDVHTGQKKGAAP
jgi:hypothetical protein